MTSLSLADWLERLEKQHPNAIDLGLDRVRTVAERMERLSPASRIVTVAGTNGKGSTTAVLEALAREAGLSTGLYTSPHLLRYNERVRLNGTPVDDRQLVDAFERIEALRGDTSLTYFEFGTLAALDIFSRAQPELIILEVGLGGRLDAVNIVDPDVAVITSIALDHESWLGNNRNSIGREKAGILRPGIDAVVVDPEPPPAVEERLRELNCKTTRLQDIPLPTLSAGPLRRENVAGAVAAARLLGIEVNDADLPALVERVQLPGRLQTLRFEDRDVLLDVGHNPAATAHLRDWVAARIPGPRIALFAALSDKNIHAMITPCRDLFDAWYVVGLPLVSRAFEVTDLADLVTEAGVRVSSACTSVSDAWQRFRRDHPEGTLVVFGSFYTVAGFLELVENRQLAAQPTGATGAERPGA